MTLFILICYFSILTVLCIYGAHRFFITRVYLKQSKETPEPKARFKKLPKVTIQLPLFNERFVVERLIDAVVKMDYPRDLLQIQVLDDSTDDTVTLAAARVAYWRRKGIDIVHLHRTNRQGFKAGALAEGLESATGDFVAIFDADFVPPADMLQKTVHYFSDDEVGMVQTRWGHLNRSDSTLTEVQGILLDAHFLIEHGGRCYSGCFFNFNGTAGIWRREAIDEAGGWQHDTLTEDLDLSYRSQLKKWRFLFLPDVVCPAELPASVGAFKSQQHRWAKGSIQVMLKLLPTIWRAPVASKIKWEAFFHLTGNLCYLLMLVNSIFFVIPSMVVRRHLDWWLVLAIDGPLFVMLSASFIYFYLTAQKAALGSLKGRKRFIPALMAVGLGLTINNSRAVIEALRGVKSPFVRTPKDGDVEAKANVYRMPRNIWSYFEVGLGMMYTAAIVWAITAGAWGSIPFLVLFQNGFYFMGLMSLIESKPTPPVLPQGKALAA